MGMSDRVRAMEGKGMSEKKRVASMEGKGVSEKERVVSMEGKGLSEGLSEKERVSSMEGKGVSEKERVVSMEGKGVSEKERVVSMEANGEGKGLSEKERVVSMEGNGKVEPPPPFQIEQQEEEKLSPAGSNNLKKILMVTSLAAGVQFGWALQLSLLTPYVQLLGIPHKWAGYIWLCGPITGIIVQPLVGYYSDRCTSRFGRRRPFIAVGTLLIAIAVFLIGFAADLGHSFGDDEKKKSKPRAIAVFVVGFWIYDVANNMLGAPCRALLADLSGNSQKKTRMANMIFAFFMAVGNVLGYAAGSFRKLYKVFPFTKTEACDIYCANLKSCFIIHIFLLLTLTALLFIIVTEIPWSKPAPSNAGNKDEKKSMSIVTVFRELKRPMWILLLVTALNYIAWCPFFLYDTDWMGREVYGGKVGEGRMYDIGVHAGSLGLMLNSVVIGCMSLAGEFIARRVGGVKRLWGGANFLLAVCLGLTVLITKLADSSRRFSDAARTDPLPPPTGVKAGALTIFAVLGIPQAVVYTVPFALASIFSNDAGAGQGVSLGVLNLAIVIPQLIVSVTAGPWDELFGGGNLPAFIVGAISAAVSGMLALTILPSPSPEQTATKTNGIPHH